MLITELFPHMLQSSIVPGCITPTADILPTAYSSIPELQDTLLYLCAFGTHTLHMPEYYEFQRLDSFLLLLTLDGEGRFQSDSDDLLLAPGTLLLWDCRDYYRLEAVRSPWRFQALYFQGNAAQTLYEEICRSSFPCLTPPALSPVRQIFMELTRYPALLSPWHMIHANCRLTELLTEYLALSELSKEYQTHPGEAQTDSLTSMSHSALIPPRIADLALILDTHFSEPHDLKSLAHYCHMNSSYLCREFKKYYGQSPIRYLTLRRLKEAKQLIENTNLTIQEIGARVGIENTTHFIRLFRDHTGQTPAAYRQTFRLSALR